VAFSARTLLLGVAVLVAVALSGAAVRLATLDHERIRVEVQTHLSNAFGLEVRVGHVGFALGWRLRISVDDLRIANLPGREAPHLLEAERVALSLRLWPLLGGRVDCDEIALHGAALHLEGDAPPDSAPRPDWDALEDGREGEAVRLALREVEAEGLVVWVGSEQAPRRISIEEASLEESGPGELGNVRMRGEVDGGRFRLEGRLGPAAALTDPALTYAVQLEGSALGAEWEVNARLQQPLALRGIDVAALSVSSRGGEAHASGRVADARAFRGVDLVVQAKVTDEVLLEGWLGKRLPHLDALDVAGSLRDTDGSLGFEGKLLATAQGGDVVLELDGVHGNVDDLADLDAGFMLRAADAQALLRVARVPLDLPHLSSVTAKGRVHGGGGVLGVRDVVLNAGAEDGLRLSAKGSVANLRAFTGVEVEAEFGAPDAAALSEWLGRPLPLTGLLTGSLELSDADGSLGIDRLRVSDVKDEGVVDFDLEIVVGDLRGGGDIVVDAEISAEGLHNMGDLVGVGLPPVGPAVWKGRVRGSTASLASDGALRVGGTTLHARSHWQEDAAGRGALRVTVHTPELRIADFGVSPDGWAGQEDERFAWARSRRKLDVEALRGFDATLAFDAARIVGRRGYAAEDMHADLDLRHGVLSFGYEETLDDSPLALTISADVRADVPIYGLRVDSQRFDLTVPAAQVQDEPHFSGVVDFEAELQGRGRTPDAIRRSLAGRFLVTGRDGTFASKYARAFFRDLFRRVLERDGEQPPERYRCLKGDFLIERGVLQSRDLFIDMHGVHLVGRGAIDLADGRWDLVIRPRVYGPGLIGGGATVEVAGPLAKPSFRARPLSLPVSMGETLATRILSPLELVARPITGTRDPCEGLP
jgi:hypothetical protein